MNCLYWVECSRSVKLTALISSTPIKLTALLLIRAVSLTGLFLFKKSTMVHVKLVEDQHVCTTLRMEPRITINMTEMFYVEPRIANNRAVSLVGLLGNRTVN